MNLNDLPPIHRLLILFAVLLTSCGNPSQPSDPMIVAGEEENQNNAWYTHPPVPMSQEDLHQQIALLQFFDEVVKNRTGVAELDSAYHVYMESIRYQETLKEILVVLAKDKTQVDSFLACKQNEMLFRGILRKDYFFGDPGKTDTVGHVYIPNQAGIYMALLREAALIDSVFYEYGNSLQAFGQIPPHIVAGFQHLHPKLEFQNDTIRLLVAVHYVSLISETSKVNPNTLPFQPEK